MQMVKNRAYKMCYPVCLRQCSVRAESVHTPWGAVGLGRCLVLWPSIFLPLVGAECHTCLIVWLCRHAVSRIWLAAAGVLYWGRDYFLVP